MTPFGVKKAAQNEGTPWLFSIMCTANPSGKSQSLLGLYINGFVSKLGSYAEVALHAEVVFYAEVVLCAVVQKIGRVWKYQL